MADNNNVVQFPKEYKQDTIEVDGKDMKLAITSTLLIVFAIAIGINATIFSPMPTSTGRGIASVNPNEDYSFEIKVKKTLKNLGKADLKESGSQPSKLDELTFGFLKGKYSIDMMGGDIKRIKLTETPNEILGATFIPESTSFLQKYAKLFAKRSASISKLKVNYTNGTKVENFAIYDKRGKQLVDLNLVTDEDNRFVELAVK